MRGKMRALHVDFTRSLWIRTAPMRVCMCRRAAGAALVASAAGAVLVSVALSGSSVAAALPPPRFAHSFDIGLISGVVIVKPPAGPTFRLGTEDRSIPVGSGLDTTHGAVDLRAAYAPAGGSDTKSTSIQDGHFSGGLFKVIQRRRQAGLTVLNLNTTLNPSQVCARQSAADVARPRPRVLGLLKASVHGAFRARGRYAAATARGTQWVMIDRCDGTLTKVMHGVVVVNDFRLHKNVSVPAGHSYLAQAA